MICKCENWCRAELDFGKITNHHPRCSHYNDSLIDIWRVTAFDGMSYVSDKPVDEYLEEEGVVITKEKMHREVYDQLIEFGGF